MRARKSAVARAAKESAETAPDAQPKRPRAYLPASERRKLIIQAAQEVFSRTNLQGARTRDIAKAATVNQATVFEHFESKEALFHEAVVLPMLEAMRGMHARAQAYEAASNAEEIAALAQASALRQVETMVEIFPLFTAALFSDQELGRKLYTEQIAPLLKERSEAIRGIVKDGLDPEFVELALFGAIFALAMDRIFKNKNDDLTTIAAQLTSFAANGFLADKFSSAASRKPRKRSRKK